MTQPRMMIAALLSVLATSCKPPRECWLEPGDTYVDCDYPRTDGNYGRREDVERTRACVVESITARRSFHANGVDPDGRYQEAVGVRRDGAYLVYNRGYPCRYFLLMTFLSGVRSAPQPYCVGEGDAGTWMGGLANGGSEYQDRFTLEPIPPQYANQPPSCAPGTNR